MRAFIAHAQSFDPIIPHELHNYIVAKYVEKRKFQREGSKDASYMYVTPRTLLAIIRLAQSMAKLNFRNVVKQTDVDEALHLMDFSIRSLRKISGSKEDKARSKKDAKEDQMAQVIRQVREAIAGKTNMTVNQVLSVINKRDIT